MQLESRPIITERRVELPPGAHEEFTNMFKRRRWNILVARAENCNETIVKEFYDNAYPLKITDKVRISWVRGHKIYHDRDAINDYLHVPDLSS